MFETGLLVERASVFGVREFAPALEGAGSCGRGRARCKSAGKPDPLQTLRETLRHLLSRQRLECAELAPAFGGAGGRGRGRAR